MASARVVMIGLGRGDQQAHLGSVLAAMVTSPSCLVCRILSTNGAAYASGRAGP
jgi:hypothetical protein